MNDSKSFCMNGTSHLDLGTYDGTWCESDEWFYGMPVFVNGNGSYLFFTEGDECWSYLNTSSCWCVDYVEPGAAAYCEMQVKAAFGETPLDVVDPWVAHDGTVLDTVVLYGECEFGYCDSLPVDHGYEWCFEADMADAAYAYAGSYTFAGYWMGASFYMSSDDVYLFFASNQSCSWSNACWCLGAQGQGPDNTTSPCMYELAVGSAMDGPDTWYNDSVWYDESGSPSTLMLANCSDVVPTEQPSMMPSMMPTGMPTMNPSMMPISSPSMAPTGMPSMMPTMTPTMMPVTASTSMPTSYVTTTTTDSPDTTETVSHEEKYCFDSKKSDYEVFSGVFEETGETHNGVEYYSLQDGSDTYFLYLANGEEACRYGADWCWCASEENPEVDPFCRVQMEVSDRDDPPDTVGVWVSESQDLQDISVEEGKCKSSPAARVSAAFATLAAVVLAAVLLCD